MDVLKLILTIVQVILCVFLIVTILLQPSKQAGINGAISGAAETFFSKNQSKSWESILAKLTTAVAILFIICTLTLCVL